MELCRSYFAYWGKAKRDAMLDGADYHLLPYHSLDVAAVASQWWDQAPAIRRAFTSNIGLSAKQTKAWVLFFVALHDLGKIDIRFQLKSPDSLYKLWPGFSSDEATAERQYYHGSQGFLVFRQQIARKIGVDVDSFLDWLTAVCGHHGVLQMQGTWQPPDAEDWVLQQDEKARRAWVVALIDLYLKPADIDWTQPLPECPPLLAGFCSVCDWVGSNSEFFKFCSEKDGPGLVDYWQTALKSAAPLIQDMGLHREHTGIAGMGELFPELEPRQLQTTLSQLSADSGLTLIEAPTGSGKTEAALTLASQLLAENRADSIIFALPTQATANAMLDRLEVAAGRLYEGNTNLVLAHGRARFNQSFDDIKLAAETPNAQGDEAAQVQCARWLGESRKRVFLGQIGVCTIDQVLISVLPVRHNFVRSFGLQKSVLIVDEVHAYDAYMYGLLTAVLSAQQQAGGSAILLSATLPAEHKSKLLAAWGTSFANTADGKNNRLQPYPLVTQVCQNQVRRIQIEDKAQQPEPREIQTELVSTEDCLPDEPLMNRIIEAAEQGALVGIVCNLVTDAQQLYQRLVVLGKQSDVDIPVDLFHARYCFEHRQHHEQRVLEAYGKGDLRARGRILVATQVIEQSLDLDFDWLISQICPVDLLFQRFGRLHRHDRDNRPVNFAGVPRAVVLVPDVEDDFGLHQLVYASGRLLWRTKQLLQETPAVQFPDAYRKWIEKVYDDEPWQDEPSAIQKSHEDYQTKSRATYYCARQLANTEYSPAADTDENVACMTRDGDMNLNVLLLQESAEGMKTLTGAVLTDLDEWDQQEAILLSTVGVPASWRKWLPAANEVGVIEITMKRNKTVFEWSGTCRLTYRPDTGLEKTEL